MKIVIEKHNPQWKHDFQLEYDSFITILDESESVIEHIGSTSVNGLSAKPIVDIMIGLLDFNQSEKHIKPFEKIGYTYVSEYENVMPNRRFFIKSISGKTKFHIHMVGLKTEFWKRHIAFRNHLISNENDKKAYSELKFELSKKDWKDGNEYANAKSDFIRNIEQKL